MKKFKFYFLDGETAIGEGESVAKAFANAGYSSGAIAALDYYQEGDEITE